MVTIPKWMVYDIVLTTLTIVYPIVSIAMSVHFSHEVCLLCTLQEEISDVRRSPGSLGFRTPRSEATWRRIKALVDRSLQYHIEYMTRLMSYIYIYI